jgi:hypothetical protein
MTCTGLCEWGDLEYDSDNVTDTYDGGQCRCKRCPNFVFCHTWTSLSLCGGCKVDLRSCVLEHIGKKECPVCLNNVECVGHPAQCGHAICGDCLFKTLANCTTYPNPSDYGLVRDCECDGQAAEWGTHTCEQCNNKVKEWESTNDGMLWINSCMTYDAEEHILTCPMCRCGV